MNAKILTMTNPKGVRLDGGGHGQATLTKDDLNGATSACHPAGLGMLQIRIAGDETVSQSTYDAIYKEAIPLAKKWRCRNRSKRLTDLIKLAMFEMNQTPVCPACKGRTYNRLHKPCYPCKGSGKYLIKDSQRARAMNMSQSTWGRVWERRYIELQQLISELESMALRQLSHALSDC